MKFRLCFKFIALQHIILPIVLFVSLMAGASDTVNASEEATWKNSAQRVLQLAEEMDNRTNSSARFEKHDRMALQNELKRLRAHLKKTQKRLSKSKKELADISTRRAQLADQYQHQMADIKTVEGIFRTSIGHSISRFEHSPVSPQYPDRLPVLEKLAKEELLLDIHDMQQYIDILFADISATGGAETIKTQVIGIDGRSKLHNVYRAGGFFLGYQDSKNSFFALPQGKLPPKSFLGNGLSQQHMATWFSGQSEILPVDITGGTAFKAIEQKRDPRGWLEAGGVLLYPILIAGLVGALVVVFKTIHLFSQKTLSKKRRRDVYSALLNKGDSEALLAKMRYCPPARVMRSCLAFKDKGLDAIDNSMEESITREQSRLERFLSTVGVLASISPLLGLLGTVTGMIDTFQAITVYGTGDPRMMSTGISEALITTQAGLGIALPLLLAHHFLKRRVAALVASMEEAGSGIAAILSTR